MDVSVGPFCFCGFSFCAPLCFIFTLSMCVQYGSHQHLKKCHLCASVIPEALQGGSYGCIYVSAGFAVTF